MFEEDCAKGTLAKNLGAVPRIVDLELLGIPLVDQHGLGAPGCGPGVPGGDDLGLLDQAVGEGDGEFGRRHLGGGAGVVCVHHVVEMMRGDEKNITSWNRH